MNLIHFGNNQNNFQSRSGPAYLPVMCTCSFPHNINNTDTCHI